jgi:hypothetical protein
MVSRRKSEYIILINNKKRVGRGDYRDDDDMVFRETGV